MQTEKAKRYEVEDGKLRVYTEVSFRPHEWVLRNEKGDSFLTRVGRGFATQREAWQAYVNELQEKIKRRIHTINLLEDSNRDDRQRLTKALSQLCTASRIDVTETS